MKIVGLKNAQAKFRSWLDKRTFRPYNLQKSLIGTFVNVGIWETACYQLLQSIIRSGDVPSHMPDLVIVTMAGFEVLVSPVLSWLGYRRRRSMILAMLPMLLIMAVASFFLPQITQPEESEFCLGYNISMKDGMSYSAVIRLVSVLCGGVAILIARVVVWCHGLAYIEEHGPERVSIQLAVLLFSRVIPVAVGYRILGLELNKFQTVMVIITFLAQILKVLYSMPTSTLKGKQMPNQGRELSVSVRRVLCNPLAVSQMISLGLLTTAIWGYSFHWRDILKVKFLIFQNEEIVSYTEVIQSYGVLVSMLYIGVKWSAPMQNKFCKLKAMKQSITMSVLAVFAYVVLTATISCKHGTVAGVQRDLYANPTCSLHCGCTPRWIDFSPVCVVDDMTTYLTPCQAGCRTSENLEGLTVYKNCSCAAGGRAVKGACGAPGCEVAAGLQRAIYLLLFTVSMLTLQSHYVLLLKIADPRDKSVVLGVAGSVVALFAFVIGHIIYSIINVATCIWSNAGRCHMNSHLLPVLVGATSAAGAFLSAMICIITFIYMRNSAKKKTSETSL